MTETEMKLWDAGTQMKLALSPSSTEETVRSCVNAYISQMRSVTFVMQRESSDHAELKAWYETRMASLKEKPLLRFFNAKRVYSIHKGVVSPLKDVVSISDFRINGVLQPEGQTATFLRFDGVEEYMPGDNGGMYRLCEQYFVVLKTLVGEWLVKRKEFGIG